MANLSDKFKTRVIKRHEGTRLGRQELNAEILEDTPGALWTLSQIEDLRRMPPVHRVWRHDKQWEEIDMKRIVVSVDPAVTAEEDSDETGIIVSGLGRDDHGYTLADYSLQASPERWARRAIDAYYDFKADLVVAETNNGGDLVETVIRSIDKNVSYKKVNASRGKRVRAEPVASLYEQRRWHHIEPFPELEDQMTTWVQGDPDSPDRMDALVWGATELFHIDKDGPAFMGAA
jgi:phage terminase large subunit-like protein